MLPDDFWNLFAADPGPTPLWAVADVVFVWTVPALVLLALVAWDAVRGK